MPRFEFSLLGGFHASVDGSQVTGFDTDKTRALLVYVCMASVRAHSREALAGLLWPELPEDAARRNLRNSLFKLRQILGDTQGGQGDPPLQQGLLLVTSQTVQRDPAGDYWCDAAEFSGLIAACKAHRHRKPEYCSSCRARLEQATEVYRGDFLRGFHLDDCQAFEEWLVLKREELHLDALDAFDYLSTYHEARGDHEQALSYAYRQLELEPWREEAHRQAMRLLALNGQRSAALAQYETCCRALAQEFDAEPGAETRLLYERIKAGDREPGVGSRGSEKDTDSHMHNLPRQLAPFIGRKEELVRILERFDSPDYGLITLMGPGGVGKTRLALRAASEQVGAFKDGVYWVPLASISSPQLFGSSIAQTIGFRFEAPEDPESQLTNYLHDKEMLLVLDNIEHLLGYPQVTGLLLSIVKEAPHISVLVTSRVRLGLQGEFLLDMSGLTLPSMDDGRWTLRSAQGQALDDRKTIVHTSDPLDLLAFDAVQLFVERAQQVDPGFALTSDRAQGVVDICRLVNGLPLGIVLAAAWVRHFSPARIAGSIRGNLDFLSSTARDAAPQHASLRAVFTYSWNLLSEEEQRVFRDLPVFRGGWEEEAAEKVAGASADTLLSLVDKSLLRRDATGRFEIHEVLRQYATEKLDELPNEQDAVRRRHANYYLELAKLAESGLKGDEQGKWFARLEREHDNMRAVLHWGKENEEIEIGLQLGAALWRFWYVRGYNSEGREHLAALLAMSITTGIQGTLAASGVSHTSTTEQTEPAESADGADQQRIIELMRTKAIVLNGAGVLASVQGDQDVARAFYEESLTLSRGLGDKQGMASSLNNLGIIAHQLGDSDAGRLLHEESLSIRRELGDTLGIAASLNNLGLAAQEQGDYDEARVLHEESLAIRRELGDTLGIAASLGNLGLVAQERGDYGAARSLYDESLTLRRGLGDKGGMAELFNSLGLVAKKQGNYDEARDLYEQGLTLSRELGYTWSIALLLNNLGLVAQEQGDYDEASTLHKESLAIRRELGDKLGIAGAIACLGAVAAGRVRRKVEARTKEPQEHLEQLERAARLLGAVDTLLESTSVILTIDDRQLYEQNLSVVRSLLNEDAFAKAWEEGKTLNLDQAINYAIES